MIIDKTIYFGQRPVFKLYSKGCEYAIRALTQVILDGSPERFQIKEVCERAGISESFTRKVFQSLVQGGFLEAHRGPGGGYGLKRPPEEITILEVIRAVEGEDTFDHCVMGLPQCNPKKPCPLHHAWASAKEELLAQLSVRTLRDVAHTAQQRDPKEKRRKRGSR